MKRSAHAACLQIYLSWSQAYWRTLRSVQPHFGNDRSSNANARGLFES
ncbi:hypothetical protein BRPE64_BCDS06380 [Caballeronia insecticola]|uniref:Uncharacterized protein n=1 Tax=Caballeronia insecticola TaxID=758793 RepID=R4WLG5_9BURK|nr:hypothetical protein BRPE64_BCDS06380 [Caballeronia insecticola]